MLLSQAFNVGERVQTPLGPGTVLKRRMVGPNYIHVQAYSVQLDSKMVGGYFGTTFLADQITLAP